MIRVGLQDDYLQHSLQRTKTALDRCAIDDNIVSLCTTCNSAIAKRAILLLSAGNFANCLFCQDSPRAHVVGIFLKLMSGAKRGLVIEEVAVILLP
jgi:hypothetical protein